LYANLRQAAIGEEKSLGNLFELPNGRSIVVTRRPLPGPAGSPPMTNITERREAEAQVSYMTHYDGVTDLPNRALFRDRLDAALSRLRRMSDSPFFISMSTTSRTSTTRSDAPPATSS